METRVMNCITPKQIKKIHALKNRLGWSDEQYREYLMTNADGFATSCKDLSEQEAQRIIRKMERIAVAKGVWQIYRASGARPAKYDDLGNRPNMASPKQLRMIEAMWKEVSYYRDAEKRERALRYFLHRIIGVDDMRFLESWQVRKVVEALRNMNKLGVRG